MASIFKDQVTFETYGETITAAQPLYKSTGTGADSGRTAGRLYKLDVTNADRNTFYGVAKDAGNAADTNKRVIQVGRAEGFSGLTAGKLVYASEVTPGAYTQTAPTAYSQSIGVAQDADTVLVNAGLASTFKAAGTGDVVGPASSTDEAVARYDLTTGKLLQNSSVFISDSGQLSIGSTTYTARLLVAGQSTVVTPPVTTLLHVSGIDATAATFSIDGYGASPQLIQRRANGTAASPTAVNADNSLASLRGQGYGATAYSGSRALISMAASQSWTDSAQGAYISFSTTADGGTSTLEKMRLSQDGVLQKVQPAQTSKAAAATLTIAEVRTQIIQYTGVGGDNLQLPTGTDIQSSTGTAADVSFDFSVINTGSGSVTLTTNTGLTLEGSMTVASLVSGLFRARRTGTNTFTVYRIS